MLNKQNALLGFHYVMLDVVIFKFLINKSSI